MKKRKALNMLELTLLGTLALWVTPTHPILITLGGLCLLLALVHIPLLIGEWKRPTRES